MLYNKDQHKEEKGVEKREVEFSQLLKMLEGVRTWNPGEKFIFLRECL